MRIFRTLLVLSGATAFMPSPPDTAALHGSLAEQQAPGLMSSATMAIADAAGFCERQPGVCETAGYMAGRLEAKAKYGVRLIYEWAAESNGEPKVSPLPDLADGSDPLATGSTGTALAAVAPASQSTLSLGDMIPAWRGPVPKKKG